MQTDKGRDASSLLGQVLGWSLVGFLGIVAFGISVLVYMPARVAVQSFGLPLASVRVSGSVWTGQAQLDAHHVVRWKIDPLASVFAFAVVADVALGGPDSALTGRATVNRGAFRLGDASGRAGWALARAVLPDLPILCDGTLVIEALDFSVRGQDRAATGIARTTPATCVRSDGATPGVPAPALTAAIDSDENGLRAVVTTEVDPATPLVSARLTSTDRLIVTVHAAGAAMVPGMPASFDSEIELPLSALLP